jgi:hypothetical protein
MDGESILRAFRDMFPNWAIVSYKRLDPHSIDILAYQGEMDDLPERHFIFTFYNIRSWKLETR